MNPQPSLLPSASSRYLLYRDGPMALESGFEWTWGGRTVGVEAVNLPEVVLYDLGADPTAAPKFRHFPEHEEAWAWLGRWVEEGVERASARYRYLHYFDEGGEDDGPRTPLSYLPSPLRLWATFTWSRRLGFSIDTDAPDEWFDRELVGRATELLGCFTGEFPADVTLFEAMRVSDVLMEDAVEWEVEVRS